MPAAAIADYIALLEHESAGGLMVARRSRGVGGLHFDSARQRWIATVSFGYDPAGKRIVKRGSGKTKTEARAQAQSECCATTKTAWPSPPRATPSQGRHPTGSAHGLNGRDRDTIITCTILCQTHIIPALGAGKLRDLRAESLSKWLAVKAAGPSAPRTLMRLHSCLNRTIGRAMAGDNVTP